MNRHASPLGDLFAILPSGASQYGTWAGWIQNGVRERLCLARCQDQHGAFLNRMLGGGFGTVEDKIGHGAAFQVCRALNQELLLLLQAGVEISVPAPNGGSSGLSGFSGMRERLSHVANSSDSGETCPDSEQW